MDAKLDIALISVPIDVAAELMAFASEQAFAWAGVEPDRNDYYIHLGRILQRRTEDAWDRKLNNVDRSDNG